MASVIRNILLSLLSEKCTDKYLVELDIFDVDCFKALLSKGLGYGIIAGSLLVKVPQIHKIITNRSAEGINLFSVLLDLFAITCHMSYSVVSGFTFSSWGDGVFLAIQTLTIAALILFYGGSTFKSLIFIVSYFITCFVLMSGFTSLKVLWYMQACNIPVLVTGKLSQAWTNYKNSSTGQLSAATCFMLFGGSMARVFTSIQETGDFMMILTYSVSTMANAIVAAQIVYYWNKSQKSETTKKTKLSSKPKAKKAD